MSPKSLAQKLERIFGPLHTAEKAGVALRVHRSAVFRWLAGDREIPGPVESAIELAELVPPEKLPRAWRK